MIRQPYHKYIFDFKKRKVVGEFERMYSNEDKGGYDSWFQEDVTTMYKQLSLLILERYNFNSILDIGCGKGYFTHLLKKENNRVLGTDLSRTAIKKAKAKYPSVEFLPLSIDKVFKLKRKWDLIVMMGVLDLVKNWKEVVKSASRHTSYVYIFLHIPPDPIGHVKSFEDITGELNKYFKVEIEIICNKRHLFILGKTRR